MSLLDEVKKVHSDKRSSRNEPVDEEMLDLALAYVRGEISMNQVAHALELEKADQSEGTMRTIILRAVRAGKLIKK